MWPETPSRGPPVPHPPSAHLPSRSALRGQATLGTTRKRRAWSAPQGLMGTVVPRASEQGAKAA